MRFATIIIIITFSLCLMSCADKRVNEASELQTNLTYFNEVVYGSEFGSANNRIRKWVEDVNIHVVGTAPKYLLTELEELVIEINQLIGNPKLKLVASREDSNFVILFGNGEQYAKLEPKAKHLVADNWGLFWVYWNGKSEIYKGSMFVDTDRNTSIKASKHLLREELTQSLGIMKDSYEYPSSIFYQKWSTTTEYSAMDKFVIKTLYDERVQPGMKRAQVRKVFTQ